MTLPIIPLVVAVIGALMYGLCGTARLQEIGRILFFVGTFWFVSGLTGKQLHF